VLINTIADVQPDLIGYGCLFSGNFPEMLKLSEAGKRKYSDIPAVIGGIHPTIYAREILTNCPSIDWIVLGEGEESIVQLVNTIKDGKFEFQSIAGLAHRKDGNVVINQKTTYINDADSIPFPAYDLVNFKDYYVDTSEWQNPKQLPINTSIPIISSRSCPNRCRFCSMFLVMGTKWRARSAKNTVDEIEYVYRKYDHRHFSFMDDNFSLHKPRVLKICDEIQRRKLDIQFETPNGLSVSTLDEEVLDALVGAGMVRTYIAIESGSDYIRNKIMKKHLKREKIFEIVKLLKKYKTLNVAAFFIIGMPEETWDTLMETYNMISEIDIDRVFLMNIVPFPGTEVFDQALRDGLLVDTDLEKLYLADDRYLTNYDKFFLKPYNLELEDLRRFREKCEDLIAVKKRALAREVPRYTCPG
jgi:magnesium-protoporphyrin IX monomethyl ester (oxidative) cyclase